MTAHKFILRLETIYVVTFSKLVQIMTTLMSYNVIPPLTSADRRCRTVNAWKAM